MVGTVYELHINYCLTGRMLFILKILVTNEDGIFSAGVIALSELLSHFGKVTVICPQNSDYINNLKSSLNRPFSLKKVEYSDAIDAYTVDAAPSECVKLGIEEITDGYPDFVFSGINLGANVGRDAFKSPSTRAIEEAFLHDIPSAAIAINEFNACNINFSKIKDTIFELLSYIMTKTLPGRPVFNINIPNETKSNIKGLKVLPLDTNVSKYKFKKLISLDSDIYYFLEDTKDSFQYNKRSDVFYIQQNYITVSPIVVRNTCDIDIENYQNWFAEIQHESTH